MSVVPYFQATHCQTSGFGFWSISINQSATQKDVTLKGDADADIPASLLGQQPILSDTTLVQSGVLFGAGHGGYLGSNSDLGFKLLVRKTFLAAFSYLG